MHFYILPRVEQLFLCTVHGVYSQQLRIHVVCESKIYMATAHMAKMHILKVFLLVHHTCSWLYLALHDTVIRFVLRGDIALVHFAISAPQFASIVECV